MKKGLFFLPVLLVLGACSSNDKVSEKEVKKAVNEIYEQEPICLRMRLAYDYGQEIPNYRFGDDEIKIKFKNNDGDKVNKTAIEQMDILAKQGYYKERNLEKIKYQKKLVATYKTWQITDDGVEYFNGSNAICIGHFQFKDLLYYSVPGANVGRQVSHVTYAVEPNIEKWAKKFLKVTDKNIEKSIEQEQEKTATFYLTNKGWKILRGRH